jgi:hypothetical protein
LADADADAQLHRLQFDPDRYRAANPDLAQFTNERLAHHWLHHGREEERRGLRRGWRAPHFDRQFYLANNPDVAGLIDRGVFNTPEEHWLLTGRDEVACGKRPAFGDFNEALYLGRRPDVVLACANGAFASGFDHWLVIGRWQEREARSFPHQPVVPCNRAGVLSPEKQRFWEKNGYIVLEGAITPERCERANKRINELWAARRSLPKSFSIDIFLETPQSRRVAVSDATAVQV